jgi:uncharacterized membrane protein
MMDISAEQHSGQADLRSQAVRRLHLRRQFHAHLTAYVLVNVLLVAVWLVVAVTAGVWFPWPVFPILGWGIGLAFHARSVYARPISEADIQREVERLRGQ